MTTYSRRRALALLAATTAAACSPAVTTGPLGDDPFEGGIGGTGIVGTMVASGSILINGLRVEVPNAATLTLNGAPASESAMRPGLAMTVVAQSRQGRFEAQRVDAEHPLIGLVSRSGSGLSINGTTLHMDLGASGQPVAGRRMAASGVWRADGGLQVSLIQAVPNGADRVAGTVIGSPARGWRIGQTVITPPQGGGLIAGQYASVLGQFSDGTLRAARLQLGRFRPGTSLNQLSVEGFLEPIASAPGFRIAGLGHSFARRLDLTPFEATRGVFFGRYDGLFAARRAVALSQSVAERRALLVPESGASVAVGLAGQAAQPILSR